MLDLIETAIDADPRLAALRGRGWTVDTVHRGAAVARFQEGDVQFVLLSLKAVRGGLTHGSGHGDPTTLVEPGGRVPGHGSRPSYRPGKRFSSTS
jgi:hypothetical protein